MKGAFFARMAGQGIVKNKRLYLPYLATSAGLVMMDYIVAFLAQSRVIRQNLSAGAAPDILNIGTAVIAFFSLLFLFYSNSLIMRRRKREFGLYNILGLDKWGLTRMALWESLLVAGLSILIGLGLGVLLSKLAELGLCHLLHIPVSFDFTVERPALLGTGTYFAVIFALILANDIRQVWFSRPIDLLHSESAGEKPPKGNWFIGLLGLALLGAAYAIALTIQNPMTALVIFFLAVLLVIAGTYLIFIAGSVSLCRLLQKRKGYYYKPAHFVSVSSMVYRMKRNGAGLASICILLTMVLVMIGSSLRLYVGVEEGLHNRYPTDFSVEVAFESLDDLNEENLSGLRADIEAAVAEVGVSIQNPRVHVEYSGMDYFQGNQILFRAQYDQPNYLDLDILPLSYYNDVTGESAVLAPGEAFYGTSMLAWEDEEIVLGDTESAVTLRLRPAPTPIPMSDVSMAGILALVVPDDELVPLLQTAAAPTLGGNLWSRVRWIFSFDTDASVASQRMAYDNIKNLKSNAPRDFLTERHHVQNLSCYNREMNRSDHVSMYGGFLYLGILLSLVFLFAAVMIIYYKQISEGYEDQPRFAIMRKVGMTRRDIRKSINSQMLTVFFLPLLFAGLHLLFAIPILSRMMYLFYFNRLAPLLLSCGVSFLFFGILYAFAYRWTSNAYYQIVSGSIRERG